MRERIDRPTSTLLRPATPPGPSLSSVLPPGASQISQLPTLLPTTGTHLDPQTLVTMVPPHQRRLQIPPPAPPIRPRLPHPETTRTRLGSLLLRTSTNPDVQTIYIGLLWIGFAGLPDVCSPCASRMGSRPDTVAMCTRSTSHRFLIP